MGMPGRAFWLTRAVVNLTHLVHVDKGVQVLLSNPGEGASYWETLSLQSLRGGSYQLHGSRTLRGERGNHFGKFERIIDSDGRHSARLMMKRRRDYADWVQRVQHDSATVGKNRDRSMTGGHEARALSTAL